ncbi:MAG: hypothetical protein KME49_25520 [Brasilonema octagenarum HA4186-MV1]|jgi:alpha-acetolactate decarboxylase|uniref:Uncharacterized protein n=2 Tax=Brasilonema TaxID=383614 RepID=A0A856MKT7_9CYAN|nr:MULTISPECIES: hypothetical protein [Brasilonema]MBW4628780.1 hypothetical protein [Brasilonema octagenarum HA4186-MV1]NMF63154.1 hypothetical protein [Brasilonema octagenarum UFV-OR1]QDL11995.1 hypothetical protein DP114_32490 [Brasilonema sennae CENA114]QDL18370.1 hypothetical protein DP113_32590 [Brasilonema octagenarum UFV-E1]
MIKLHQFSLYGVFLLVEIQAFFLDSGHLLDGIFQNAQVEIDAKSDVQIALPKTTQFEQADLGDGKAAEINKIER